MLGHFDPVSYHDDITIKEDRVRYWMEHGAKPTRTVQDILKRRGLKAEEGRA